jgi:hypothetical protein
LFDLFNQQLDETAKPSFRSWGCAQTLTGDFTHALRSFGNFISDRLAGSGEPPEPKWEASFKRKLLKLAFGDLAISILVLKLYEEMAFTRAHGIRDFYTLHGSNFLLGMSFMLLSSGVAETLFPELYDRHPELWNAAVMLTMFSFNAYYEYLGNPAGLDIGDFLTGTLAMLVFPLVHQGLMELSDLGVRGAEFLGRRFSRESIEQMENNPDALTPQEINEILR